jgi:DNA-binding Lrp family transcriptional regulator
MGLGHAYLRYNGIAKTRKLAEIISEPHRSLVVTNLDPIDLTLIDAVQQNASQRLEDLGRLVKLAPSSVHERLRRLERDGIIRRWTVALDAQALGLGVLAFIGVRSSLACSSVLGGLTEIPEIEEVHSVAGELCFLLKVRVADTNALLGLIERLRQIEGIEQTQTTVVLKTQLDRPIALPVPMPPGRGKVRAVR